MKSSARMLSMNLTSLRRSAASQSRSSCIRMSWSDLTGCCDCAAPAGTAQAAARRQKSVARYVMGGGRLFHHRLGELRGIDCHVRLHSGQLVHRAPIQPAHRPLERHLDPGDIAIVAVIDACYEPSDRRSVVAYEPDEQ